MTLLEQGFTVGQLGYLGYAGLAKLRGSDRPKVFRVKITAAGREGARGVIGVIHHCDATALSATSTGS